MPPTVELWTDGSGTASGPGGWAYVLRAGPHEREGSGFELETTSQRMEITALLRGLQALRRPCHVDVRTDSRYVMGAFAEGWLQRWFARDFHKVANRDLWLVLADVADWHDLRFEHVRGHTGVELNERCDKLAGAARRQGLAQLAPRDATPLEVAA